ncbi:MAG TPA: L,D-transpeptidase family protein [Candidatus Udaeobacter sp.]|jgi:murein L,D-transpeptidase YcbB/YkuD|nr:L,D-transpeptidase family protein [Candidatus Udaeobacter sp.]
MSRRLVLSIGLFGAVLLFGCGASGPSSDAVSAEIQRRVATPQSSASEVAGERLIKPQAVARFYQARHSAAAWDSRSAAEIVEAIRDVARDGLNPSDYHLATIASRMQNGAASADAGAQAELDILLTDAVAAIADHLRYGRVAPKSLNSAWNVDPREGAPPLESTVDEIARSSSVRRALEGQRPDHFIYRGLVDALARLRDAESRGGWPTIPAGPKIRPGAQDARVPAIRARLAMTGELGNGGHGDGVIYDASLRRAVMQFQADHRLDSTGVIDPATLQAMNVSPSARAGQLRVNLERARWVLGGLKDDFLLVNLPAFKAYLIQGGRNIWEARTQIGDEAKQTPTFRATLTTVVFNPDWTVPISILEEELLDDLKAGRNVLEKKGLVLYDSQNQAVDASSIDWNSVDVDKFPYTLRQPPGPTNALGRVKFLFPNPFSIYLHDTPSRQLFATNRRTFSHGCIRLERPLELAEVLLRNQDGWNAAKIQQALSTPETQNVDLEHRIPILIVYWTVSVGASGRVHLNDDIYGLDPPLLTALDAPIVH